MKKVLFIFLLTICVLKTFGSSVVFADVVNPEFLTKTCSAGEQEITCSYSSKIPFGPRTRDTCVQYQLNPAYRLLTGTGSSFGGSEKYCYSPSKDSFSGITTNLFTRLFVTLLFELPIFFVLGFRSRRSILFVFVANLISVPVLFFSTPVYSQLGILGLVIAETIVIILEGLILYLGKTGLTNRQIIKGVVLANFISASLGSAFIYLLSLLLGGSK